MDEGDLAALIEDIRTGTCSPDDALRRLRRLPYTDLGFARVDHHRELRQGFPEAVYAPGKTPTQCARIVAELLDGGSGPVIMTRASDEQATAVTGACPGAKRTPRFPNAQSLSTLVWRPAAARPARVMVVTAGTGDLPVADECVATLEAYGIHAELVADCGVAGVHRILAAVEALSEADAVVVIAGMEGALASLVGGLTGAPVIAVPTSVGYGSSLEGVTALLAMHASCAAGIAVVGIDNGYGAACAVARAVRI